MKTARILLYLAALAVLFLELRNERAAHEATKDALFFANVKIVRLEIDASMDRMTIHNLRTGKID